MNIRKVIIKLSKILFAVFLPLAILLTILQYYSYNEDFYMEEFKKYDIENVTKMSYEDLNKTANKLISYMKDDEKDLNIEAVINGEMTEVFGQREKQHMVDVKELFVKGHIVRYVSFALVLIAVIIIVLYSRSRKRDIYQAVLWAGIVPIIFMIVLFILVKIDFHKYFTYFHKIFFTNDLWLLNPKTDVLIQMLPLEFFIDISTKIISWFLGISIMMTIIAFVNLKKEHKTPA